MGFKDGYIAGFVKKMASCLKSTTKLLLELDIYIFDVILSSYLHWARQVVQAFYSL